MKGRTSMSKKVRNKFKRRKRHPLQQVQVSKKSHGKMAAGHHMGAIAFIAGIFWALAVSNPLPVQSQRTLEETVGYLTVDERRRKMKTTGYFQRK